MAAIVNDRDVLMQAAVPRVVSGGASKGIILSASSSAFQVSTAGIGSPSSITLTAALIGITGATVTFSTTPSTPLSVAGNVATLAYANMSANSVAVTATVVDGGVTHSNTQTITKLNALGTLATKNYVNLASEVTGYLSSGSITGLGALSALNYINLASGYVTGTIDANTQVNNLGTLAFANSVAANQIGAGTLAAGVIYAGTINADKINANTTLSGVNITGGAINIANNYFKVASDGSTNIADLMGGNGFFQNTANPSKPAFEAKCSVGFASSPAFRASHSGAYDAVNATSGGGTAVNATASGSGKGVSGTSSTGYGVYGISSSGYGGYFTCPSGGGLYCSGSQALYADGVIVQKAGPSAANFNSVVPNSNNTYQLGASGNAWSSCWVQGGVFNSSDRRIKDFIRDSDLGLDFINSLRPRVYKMKVGRTDVSLEPEQAGPGGDGLPIPQGVITTTTPGVRDHYGLITQELREALGTDNAAMWALADKDDPESSQYIIYTELIAPMIKAIQELSAEIEHLKASNA